MMNLPQDDRKFEIVKGSDVQRDGVFVELRDITDGEPKTLLELFHSDKTGIETFYAEKVEVPLNELRNLIDAANEWFRTE